MLSPKLKEMFQVAAEFPVAPQILSELTDLLLDIRAETAEVCALLRQDGALASAMLRIANSPFYGSGGLGSVEEAVSRVGFREVHRLVGQAVTGLLADRALPYYRVEPETLRDHMVGSAMVAEFLAEKTAFNPRHAYTAGLLRPIGMMVLDRLARSTISCAQVFHVDLDRDYTAWENRVMGIRNEAVSAVLMTEWRFSTDVIEAVRGHRGSEAAPLARQEAALLHVALGVVEELGLGLPGEVAQWEVTPATLALAGLVELDVAEALQYGRLHQAGALSLYRAS
jgi:HD-like signal output (HDOD) protein